MKNHNIMLLFIFVFAVSSCAQNNENNSKEITSKNTSEDWNIDSLFQEKLNAKGLFSFVKNNKIGFKDKSGNIIVEAKYDIVPGIKNGPFYGLHLFDFLKDNTFLVGIEKNQHEGYYDENGTMRFSTFSGYEFGLIDVHGRELVKPSFELIVHPNYYSEDMPFFEEGWLGVYFPKEKKINNFINSKGEILDLSMYNSAKPIDNSLIRVEKNKKFGIVSKNGELNVPIIYDGIQVNSNLIINGKRLIEVCNGCRWINSTELCGSGDYVVDGFVKGKHGIIDENGKIVIPLAYESILSSSKVLFLNKGGKIILDGGCDLFVGGQWEIYDPITNNFSKTKYKAIDELNSTLFAVNLEEQTSSDSSKGKWGLINEMGKEILPLKYSSISLDYEDPTKITAQIGDVVEVFIWNGSEINKVK